MNEIIVDEKNVLDYWQYKQPDEDLFIGAMSEDNNNNNKTGDLWYTTIPIGSVNIGSN